MPTHLRTLLIPLPTFVLGACFDPMVDPEPADQRRGQHGAPGLGHGARHPIDYAGLGRLGPDRAALGLDPGRAGAAVVAHAAASALQRAASGKKNNQNEKVEG